ncbi:hypothetical protein SO802_027184 [Lithocarpus litseifolius]|uniref:Uncharacterized protein n=1 Tax=Lithocarpus litseifolius TaxID=425828 RepID=A0AAW2C1V3_9ROSI
MVVDCPFSEGFCADEPPMTLGKAETESFKESMGLFLSNLFLSLWRVGIADLGVQDGDRSGWVDFASVTQGIDTPHQGNQLVVSADYGHTEARVSTEGEAGNADLGLGNVENPSPLMTITPLRLDVSALGRGEVVREKKVLDEYA